MNKLWAKITPKAFCIFALLFILFLGFAICCINNDPSDQIEGDQWMSWHVCDQIPKGIHVWEILDRGEAGSSRVVVLFAFEDNEQAESMISLGNFRELSNSNREFAEKLLRRYITITYDYTFYQKVTGASTNIIAINFKSINQRKK